MEFTTINGNTFMIAEMISPRSYEKGRKVQTYDIMAVFYDKGREYEFVDYLYGITNMTDWEILSDAMQIACEYEEKMNGGK